MDKMTVDDLRGVAEREEAAIGVLISMKHPTKPVQTEAVTAGFYESKTWKRKCPKIWLVTGSRPFGRETDRHAAGERGRDEFV